jgi:hypothetical protein
MAIASGSKAAKRYRDAMVVLGRAMSMMVIGE